jgi:hypothetical protein
MSAYVNCASLCDQKYDELPEESEPPAIPSSDDYETTLAFTEKVGRLKNALCETRRNGNLY